VGRKALLNAVDVLNSRGRHRVATRVFRQLIRPLTLPAAIAAVQMRKRRIRSIDDALDLAYGLDFFGVDFVPWQVRSEFRQLLEAVQDLRPKTVVEIGTSNGGSLFCFARMAAHDAVLVSIDLPHGEFGGGYAQWRCPLYRSFASRRQHIRLLRADSHSPATLSRLSTILGGSQVDFLFIDGDHSYAGAKQDFEIYGRLVRPGGIIAFHDIVPPAPVGAGREAPSGMTYAGGEVPSLWQELKESFDAEEFVADWSSGSFGIGLLRQPDVKAATRGATT
jgi:predicted O-methyltransferase YrrM